MSVVRFAIAGLGRIASLLEKDPLREKPATHAGAIQRHPQARLVAGADPNQARREEFGGTWPGVPLYADVRELLAEARPDVLVIATPPEFHEPILKQATEHGVPMVLCEKPLAPTQAEARRMVSLCRRKSVRLMVNHERRFCLDWRHVKSQHDTKAYGDLISVDGRLFMGSRRSAGEMLLDDGTHLIDVIRFVTGREFRIQAAAGKARQAGGSLRALFELIGKHPPVGGSLEIGGSREAVVFEADFQFQRGRIRIGNGLYEEFTADRSPHYQNAFSLRRVDQSFPKTGYFENMIDAVVDAFRHPSHPLISSAEDGSRAVKVIEAILRHL